ncbi:DotI/IcmL family type IV secretion protein [Legionella dresdenensis]|uniref:DotI/IcmL family type IV secretion protein n=1 Tax=Legionella dresdenensis TaxID=450200 RepID=A0ABV8CE37_9GAMM
MKRLTTLIMAVAALCSIPTAYAAPDKTQLAVWANEAIIATYTFDYQNFMDQQKALAKYFTADGWTAYSSALATSGVPSVVLKNDYTVSAVATMPPEIKQIGNNWEAVMPVLVVYKNVQFQQKQTLNVTIDFGEAPSGQGVRGFAITHLQSVAAEPPCQCVPVKEGGTQLPLNVQ